MHLNILDSCEKYVKKIKRVPPRLNKVIQLREYQNSLQIVYSGLKQLASGKMAVRDSVRLCALAFGVHVDHERKCIFSQTGIFPINPVVA